MERRTDEAIRADIAAMYSVPDFGRWQTVVDRLSKDVEPLLSALAAVEADRDAMYRRLCDQEKYNIESRRSLCDQRDRILAERDEARRENERLQASTERTEP